MARSFVAIELPADVIAELVRIQPPAVDGIRLVNTHPMHLTLNFLGEADIERAAAALRTVEVRSFSLTLEGVGRFRSADRTTTLWAGVRKSRELLTLHSAVSDVLAEHGFRREDRPYAPHVTLARCKPHAPADAIGGFLARHSNFSIHGIPVADFSLFTTRFIDGAPVYHRERSFPLVSDEQGKA